MSLTQWTLISAKSRRQWRMGVCVCVCHATVHGFMESRTWLSNRVRSFQILGTSNHNSTDFRKIYSLCMLEWISAYRLKLLWEIKCDLSVSPCGDYVNPENLLIPVTNQVIYQQKLHKDSFLKKLRKFLWKITGKHFIHLPIFTE